MNRSLERMMKTREVLDAGSPDEPKYRMIADSLRESVLAGEYRAGSRLPSETELVRRFGVSRMTIVKAIKELQQMGLVTRRVGSGTYVAARTSQTSRLFGLLIPELGQTEIFEPICQGMASYQGVNRHSLLWGNAVSEGDPKEQAAEELCQQYIAQQVSGVFFAPLELSPVKDEVNRKIVSALDKAGIPVVLLDRCVEQYPRRSQYDLVGIDNRRTGYAATMHLVKAGARRIGFLGKQFSASTVDARIAGYREALIASGMLGQEDLVMRGDPGDTELVRKMLEEKRPDAILCANDHTAANLMQSLGRLGRRVPEDIRIVGVDDVKYASLLSIPLTTMHQPCVELGRVAMAAMLSRLENPDFPARDILLSCRLVVRQSCGSAQVG